MDFAKELFKKDRPIIRPFIYPDGNNPGDLPYLWDCYKNGLFTDLPEDLEIAQFVEIADILEQETFETHMIEDKIEDQYHPIGVVFVKSIDFENWQIEPHVFFFRNATAKIKLRAWVAFIKKTKYRKDIGACVVRADKDGAEIANKVEKAGLLRYVGKIWAGRRGGNDYIYSVRCNRRA